MGSETKTLKKLQILYLGHFNKDLNRHMCCENYEEAIGLLVIIELNYHWKQLNNDKKTLKLVDGPQKQTGITYWHSSFNRSTVVTHFMQDKIKLCLLPISSYTSFLRSSLIELSPKL